MTCNDFTAVSWFKYYAPYKAFNKAKTPFSLNRLTTILSSCSLSVRHTQPQINNMTLSANTSAFVTSSFHNSMSSKKYFNSNFLVSSSFTSNTLKPSATSFKLKPYRAVRTPTCTIELFYDVNYSGKSRRYSHDDGNFGAHNDKYSSCRIDADQCWIFYKDKHFWTPISFRTKGNYANYDEMGIPNDCLSSIRMVPYVAGYPAIYLFEDVDCRQGYSPNSASASNLNDFGFNDKTRSFLVLNGTWELFTDVNYSGSSQQFGPGIYSSMDDTNLPDYSISSIKLIS